MYEGKGVRGNIKRIEPDGEIRYFGEGCILALQLKSTTAKSVSIKENGEIIYDMEAKTYRDLVMRRLSPAPLILILFILPSERNEWLEINDDGTFLKNKAFWYVTPKEAEMTNNTSSIRVTIPPENSIRPDTLSHIFQAFF